MQVNQSAEYRAMNPTPEEDQAVWIRWTSVEKRQGEIPDHEAVRLLNEVRARVQDIETFATRMIVDKTSEGRRYPRRHMRVALAGFVIFVVIYIIIRAIGG